LLLFCGFGVELLAPLEFVPLLVEVDPGAPIAPELSIPVEPVVPDVPAVPVVPGVPTPVVPVAPAAPEVAPDAP